MSVDVTMTKHRKRHGHGPKVLALLACLGVGSGLAACAASSGGGGLTGTGGSLARFALHGDRLYALGGSQLKIFGLADGLHPELLRSRYIGWDVETLFRDGNRLFVGARNGMYIFDVSEPDAPKQLAFTGHLYSCDPVVVQGNTAYVTLRKGSACRGGENELRVYDVTDSTQPQLIGTYPMTGPWGLGVHDAWLFVADGKAGLRVFDTRDPRRLRPVGVMPEIHGYDVIPNQGVLVISAEDGLYQYDYRNGRLVGLSRLPIGKGAEALPALRLAIPPPPPAPVPVLRVAVPPPAPGAGPPEAPPPKKNR